MCFVLGLVAAGEAEESAGDALPRRQSALHAAADRPHNRRCRRSLPLCSHHHQSAWSQDTEIPPAQIVLMPVENS